MNLDFKVMSNGKEEQNTWCGKVIAPCFQSVLQLTKGVLLKSQQLLKK